MALPDDETVRLEIIVEAKKALASLRELNQAAENISTATRKAESALNRTTTTIEKGMQKASRSGHAFNQVLKLIRGTLVAIGVFRVFSFIEDSMRKGIETAKEYETSLFRIANVERILSQGGIETSVEGLRKVILDVKKELPIFSEADITQQVSLIGIMTKEFGLTEQQIGNVAKAIGVLNVRSGETEDLLTTTNKVLTALVAPSGRGIASLGLDFSQANLEAKALETGVLKVGDAFTKLSDHDKDMLKIAILLESTGQELETIQKFLDTNTGALAEQSAEWEDTLRIAGQALIGLQAAAAPFITGFLKFLQDAINGMKAVIIILQAVKDSVISVGLVLSTLFTNPRAFIQNIGQIGGLISDVFTNSLEDGFNKFFSGVVPDDAPQWFKDLFTPFVDELDTPTSNVNKFGDALQSITEIEGFDKLANDLENLGDKVKKLNEDFSIDQARAWEDFQIDIQRIVQDYAIRRQRVIEDANQKIADANRKYHNNQIDDEARFQEQLRQLREKYLFNLEDALRERDARQVLRLQRQYQMDKTALENEHALRKQEQARQHQEDLDRIRQDRDDRLAELAQEEHIRLQREREDYELKKQREEQDHQRDLEDLRRQIDDRLMEFARAFGEEYDLNEQGVQRIYDLLQQYYGPNGYFDGLYSYSYDSIVSRAQQMLAQVNAIVASANAALASSFVPDYLGSRPLSNVISNSNKPRNIGAQANGGTYLATRPTQAIFGDAGPEIAQFIPINKLKSGVGNGSASMMGGMSGKLEIEMLLSPDLEARVVRNSLQGMADVVTQVRRTKT